MSAATTFGTQSPPPCPGVFDEGGVVRDLCRVCGKCDEIIRSLEQSLNPPGARRELKHGSAQAATR